MKSDPFLIEEYKILKARVQARESRYYQMLVLTITGFITVIGFSEKIPVESIPYLMSSFLMITTLIASLSRQHQFFETAFLIEAFEENKTSYIQYETAYASVFSSSQLPQIEFKFIEKLYPFKCLYFEIKDLIKRTVSLVFHPFALLAMFSFIGSILFGKVYVISASSRSAFVGSFFYILGLEIIHLIILVSVMRHKALNTDYYRKKCREFLNKETDFSI